MGVVVQYAPFKAKKIMNRTFEFTWYYYFGYATRSGFAQS